MNLLGESGKSQINQNGDKNVPIIKAKQRLKQLWRLFINSTSLDFNLKSKQLSLKT